MPFALASCQQGGWKRDRARSNTPRAVFSGDRRSSDVRGRNTSETRFFFFFSLIFSLFTDLGRSGRPSRASIALSDAPRGCKKKLVRSFVRAGPIPKLTPVVERERERRKKERKERRGNSVFEREMIKRGRIKKRRFVIK